MQKLQLPAAGSDSRGLRLGSATASRTAVSTTNFSSDRLPRIFNRSTDVDIPNGAWSTWTPSAGARQLRRALTPEERRALEGRRADLAPALHHYVAADLDHIALAISDMFGSYTSMRQSGDEAAAKIDSLGRVLHPFPAWAIVKVCGSIQANGVWRDGKFDRRWPPNDSEVMAALREEIRHYEQCHRSAVALLAATVEER